MSIRCGECGSEELSIEKITKKIHWLNTEVIPKDYLTLHCKCGNFVLRASESRQIDKACALAVIDDAAFWREECERLKEAIKDIQRYAAKNIDFEYSNGWAVVDEKSDDALDGHQERVEKRQK